MQSSFFSESDKGNENWGEKSLMVIGFIERSEVPYEALLGDGCIVFQAGSAASLSAFSALMKAMEEDNVVAKVRRVYRAGTAPRLGILSPDPEHHVSDSRFFQILFIVNRWRGDTKSVISLLVYSCKL